MENLKMDTSNLTELLWNVQMMRMFCDWRYLLY